MLPAPEPRYASPKLGAPERWSRCRPPSPARPPPAAHREPRRTPPRQHTATACCPLPAGRPGRPQEASMRHTQAGAHRGGHLHRQYNIVPGCGGWWGGGGGMRASSMDRGMETGTVPWSGPPSTRGSSPSSVSFSGSSCSAASPPPSTRAPHTANAQNGCPGRRKRGHRGSRFRSRTAPR